MAGQATRFADLFVVGISNVVLPTSITALDFAWSTANITGAYVDEDLEQVVFYGSLPPDVAGDIKEIGLVSLSDDFVQTGLPNSLIYSFSANEQWFSDATFDIVSNSSIGPESYSFTNITTNKYLAKTLSAINMSRYDTLKLKVNTTDVSQIQIVLKNDDSNYAWKNINLSNGSNMVTQTIASFTTVGTFNPQSVNEIRFVINTVANAANSIEFDGLSIESAENGGLVARHILAVPQMKRMGATMELEFAVAI